ncbi:Aste57867_12550 [Aphanomyces stellatus]|uniref:Aste57867_12550 protein n=1 Tax=Aphanomyces stellatus TaxID=120398 RepID=A0A485KVW1_9STRA|nr:hypothetical protein As57867_012504 [Aphanomyces stellatus]VFT89401.1 Aste57867_12550 [Aphanomyces stellatus]
MASLACPYATSNSSTIQIYNQNTSSFEVVDRTCTVLAPSTPFQAVGDVSGFPGTTLNYTNRLDLVDLTQAHFPSTLMDLTFDNVGLSTTIWWTNLTPTLSTLASLYVPDTLSTIDLGDRQLKDLVVDALPVTDPNRPTSVRLTNVTVVNLTSLGNMRPHHLILDSMPSPLHLDRVDFSSLASLSIANTDAVTLSNVHLATLSSLVLANVSMQAMDAVDLGRVERITLSNVRITNWVLDDRTFDRLDGLVTHATADASSLQPPTGWILPPRANGNDSSVTMTCDATACTARHGTLRRLLEMTNWVVCVMPSVAAATTSSHDKTLSTAVIVGVSMASTVVLAITAFLLWRWCRRRRGAGSFPYERTTSPLPPTLDSEETIDLHVLAPVRIDAAAVTLFKRVGTGMFADVWLGAYAGDAVAVKTLRANQLTVPHLTSFVEEIHRQSQCHSPFVVAVVGACWSRPADLKCVLELMGGGDLGDYLASKPKLLWSDKLTHLHHIVHALVYLHGRGIIHGDVKSRNVLLDATKGTKLADFGTWTHVDVLDLIAVGGVGGTVRWIAPEVLQGKSVLTTAADMYSFGVVVSEFDSHKVPYYDATHPTTGALLSDVVVSTQVANGSLRPTLSTDMPSWLRQLAVACLAHHPNDRPTAHHVAHVLDTHVLQDLSATELHAIEH